MTSPSKIAIYPGSFDPITNGHVDIIRRGLKTFGQVIVTVAINLNKKTLFSVEERLEMIRDAFPNTPGLTLATFSDTLLVDFARQHGAGVILRGLRGVNDFGYELQMAQMNQNLEPDIETVFFMTSSGTAHISSSLIKEVARLGGDFSHAVPTHVATKLSAALAHD